MAQGYNARLDESLAQLLKKSQSLKTEEMNPKLMPKKSMTCLWEITP